GNAFISFLPSYMWHRIVTNLISMVGTRATVDANERGNWRFVLRRRTHLCGHETVTTAVEHRNKQTGDWETAMEISAERIFDRAIEQLDDHFQDLPEEFLPYGLQP